ncbi:uncharacterized protein LOC125474486 isoform X1 [Pyrus x bretschneideri]|uniref:uncharacterized protein LOC125474486 isoform X1 n=2 Tax=Pyrus x bretschneideri TaxID=225117 RepID=UPI00202F7C3F|nr:uncharacterized protein LOC125474486 isoform X1 [Pyrus x bretschneideri]
MLHQNHRLNMAQGVWKSMARGVFETMAGALKTSLHPSSTGISDEYSKYEPFFDAVKAGDWKTAKEFYNQHPEAVRARHPFSGKTALHMAVDARQTKMVEKLVKLMDEKDLEIKSTVGGVTALGVASNTGITEMAECMVKKNRKLLTIPNSFNMIPLVRAYCNGYWHMARYLYSETPVEYLWADNGPSGATIISQSFASKEFEIAWDLIQSCPKLAFTVDHFDSTPLHALAGLPSSFWSGAHLNFWQQWIYDRIDIQPPPLTVNFTAITVRNEENGQANNKRTPMRSVAGLLEGLVSHSKKQKEGLVSYIAEKLGISHIYKIKTVHVRSLAVLDVMCKEIKKLDMDQQLLSTVASAMLRAVDKGNVEFITKICKANPELQFVWNNEKSKILFHYAVQCRQEKIYNLLHGISAKDWFIALTDNDKNNMLHMAGLLAPFTQLNCIPGAALQMQRELQWYKEVEEVVPPKFLDSTNKDNLTPRDLFTKSHSELLQKGEKWMKETATSYTVVGALIITMMFAAAITVPGGNKDTGFPAFINEKLFMVFIASDAISLFSSTTATLTFLGILTSRYAEDDFLKSLPTKMIIGLATLFFAIATMMIAFSTALLIINCGHSWIVIPVILLSSVPVTLFAWMEFPLLVRITVSTYGKGKFNRNVKRWL